MGLHRSVGKALQRQRTPTHVKNSVREVSVIRYVNMRKTFSDHTFATAVSQRVSFAFFLSFLFSFRFFFFSFFLF